MNGDPDPARWRAIYESAFRGLLLRARPRKLQRGVELLLAKADERARQGETPEDALDEVYRRCRAQTIRRLTRLRRCEAADIQDARGGGACPLKDSSDGPSASRSDGPSASRSDGPSASRSDGPSASRSDGPSERGRRRRAEQLRQLLETSLPETLLKGGLPRSEADFHCDAGLGGLARWLRAAGYDAWFWPGIQDDDLIRLCVGSNTILLTTDRPLMQRAAVRWGVVPAMLVPVAPGKRAQFQAVVDRLQLPRRPARCMQCGGALDRVDKREVRDEIPPRTYPWCDDYFRCRRCGKLFWRGTHWERIEAFLQAGGK